MSFFRSTTVTLTPVYSRATLRAPAPYLIGTLLALDDVRILFDCGWSESFDVESALGPLRDVAPTLDAVAISFGDIARAGALPLLFRAAEAGGAGCAATAYMTPPVNRFAQLTLIDAHRARCAEEPEWEAGAFSAADVSAAFAFRAEGGPVSQVRFLEESSLRSGVLLTAFAAGVALGGALWRVVKGAESVVFAPALHPRSEGVMPKAMLTSALLRAPSVLVVDGGFTGAPLLADGAGGEAPVASAWTLPPASGPPGAAARPREAWEAALVETCVRTLQRGGSVLLPCDTAGRSLEVLFRLDQEYETKYPWPIYFLGNAANEVRARTRPPAPATLTRPRIYFTLVTDV
jgi:cleavage and polyadenylation specificity factor subunit 2